MTIRYVSIALVATLSVGNAQAADDFADIDTGYEAGGYYLGGRLGLNHPVPSMREMDADTYQLSCAHGDS